MKSRVISILALAALMVFGAVAVNSEADAGEGSCVEPVMTPVAQSLSCNHFCSWCPSTGYSCNAAGSCC